GDEGGHAVADADAVVPEVAAGLEEVGGAVGGGGEGGHVVADAVQVAVGHRADPQVAVSLQVVVGAVLGQREGGHVVANASAALPQVAVALQVVGETGRICTIGGKLERSDGISDVRGPAPEVVRAVEEIGSDDGSDGDASGNRRVRRRG